MEGAPGTGGKVSHLPLASAVAVGARRSSVPVKHSLVHMGEKAIQKGLIINLFQK